MDHSFPGRRRRTAAEGTAGADPTAAPPLQALPLLRKRKGFAVSKVKKVQKDPSSSTSTSVEHQKQQRGAFVGSRNRVRRDHALEDLALPLGMSFAAVLSQVSGGKVVSRDQLPAEILSMVCTSAVKESVSNIYGSRFDCFMRNFEKSFDSTWKTLQVINEASSSNQENRLREERSGHSEGGKLIYESFRDEQGNCSCSSLASTNCEIGRAPSTLELCYGKQLQEHQAFSSVNQLALYGELNQPLVCASQNIFAPGFSEPIRTTFEKSVTEQTRSNDLKAVEIGLIMRKLQMKQSLLEINSYSNLLDKVKICMNISKAAFKEEKLRNQIQDTRHAEFLRRCIDLLVSGLILMCAFIIYGASVFSYQRLIEATSSCTDMPRGSKSWWMPKPMASISSGWQMLRCHVVIITRMLFGVLMILVIAYSLLQRSVVSGPAMPVTFILLLLGVACGIAGKLCIDSLGGSGYHWLIYWEALCLIHLFANIFPSVLYRVLHGHVSVVQGKKAVGRSHWIRRYTFYSILLFVLPMMSGLLPFASMVDWKEHFTEKIMLLISRAEHKG